MGNKERRTSTNQVLNIIVVFMVLFVSIFYAGYYAYQDYLLEEAKNNADYSTPGDYGVEE
ncbi:MAG: hypothetical protein IJW28_04685 [Clostridia bacterium]|nr:hypothetical protein [Clostridia bacterium]